MHRLRALVPFAIVFAITLAPVALAQRKIIGADDEQPTDAGPPAADPKPDPKADPKAKKGDKKADEKKAAEDKAAADKAAADKKADEEKKKKKPDAAAVKKDDKRDVLEDTPAEKTKKSKEDEAKEAAEKAAEVAADAAAKKKDEDQKKLVDEKKAADAKKKLENKDQRLAAAKKVRQLTRTSGPFGISIAIEPGLVQKDVLLEVRLDVAQKLDVPDPRYGNLLPIKGANLVATVTSAKGRQRYALHPLDTPGRYGFHTTPAKDGQVTVQISGTTKEGKSLDATFPIHVGVWPPPDFEDEEKNNLATTDASRGGRKVVGGNQ